MSYPKEGGSNGSIQQATSGAPAFLSNERFRKRPNSQKGLLDFCFSISNLALIAACVVAIIFTAKFFNDDPLYDIGDYLLSLRFYRQLIYVMVILPLILLIPLLNAVSAFFLSGRSKREIGKSIVIVRIVYQVLMIVLVLVALFFIAPYVRPDGVSNQVDFELRKHIYRMHDNQFSYEFLDRIQLEYECCEQDYYIANYNKLPSTCFVQDGFFTRPFRYSCAEVIGQLVSTRCLIICICLLVILLTLASLIAMDAVELQRLASGHYHVGLSESGHIAREAYGGEPAANSSTDFQAYEQDQRDGPNNQEILTADQISERLNLDERERERQTPLLPKRVLERRLFPEPEEEQPDSYDPYNSRLAERASSRPTTPILTKANYIDNVSRPQSPLFLGAGSHKLRASSSRSPSGSGVTTHTTTPKSVLKKTSSIQRVNSNRPAEEEEEEEEEDEIITYQRKVHEELQTKRSLLSVTFR